MTIELETERGESQMNEAEKKINLLSAIWKALRSPSLVNFWAGSGLTILSIKLVSASRNSSNTIFSLPACSRMSTVLDNLDRLVPTARSGSELPMRLSI